jgi:hypothetical protein
MKKYIYAAALVLALLPAAAEPQVAQNPYTAAGASTIFSASFTTTVQVIRNGGGIIRSVELGNVNGSAVYYQFFNLPAAQVVLGTTVPYMAVYVPASSAVHFQDVSGIAFPIGISVACTTTRTGNTAPGSACDGNVTYQ